MANLENCSRILETGTTATGELQTKRLIGSITFPAMDGQSNKLIQPSPTVTDWRDMMSVTSEHHGSILVLTIDRPEVRNALDQPTLTALTQALIEAAADPQVLVVVLTGAGDRAFCAGLDLKALATHGVPDPETSPVNMLRGGYPKPVIAALNGPAVGGGFELALACDLLVAAEHCYLALPEVGRGIAASEGGTELPLRLPLAVALELGLTGSPLSAGRALELGLINQVVPIGQALPTALQYAEQISKHSPAAVAATKALMYESLAVERAISRRSARQVTTDLLAGPDAAEGAAAFVEKRAPRWTPPVTA